MGSVLLIDDEPTVLHTFLAALAPGRGFEARVARTAADGVRLAADHRPDVILLDLHLPDGSGLDVLPALRRVVPRAAVVFITVSGSPGPVIEATKLGAFDYLFKPVTLDQLDRVLTAALDAGRAAPPLDPTAAPTSNADDTDGMVGRSPVMREAYQAIGRAAPQDVTVLVTGESGTGKELAARAVWKHSRRSDAPFLSVNCAAIPEPLLEIELFGQERAAPGSDRPRPGKFEQADGGTLFLDEIGDLPLTIQAKLLRVLQDGRFERSGGSDTLRADVRVIAATHRDLESLTMTGRFRRDLYFRLSVVPIHLPPLRVRGDDVVLLTDHYIRRFNQDLHTQVTGPDSESLGLLRAYPWPGNVRELQSVLKQAVLKASGGPLRARHLPGTVRGGAALGPDDGLHGLRAFIRDRLEAGTSDLWDEARRRMDEVILPLVLAHTRGNQQQAAALLGVARQTLRTRLRELGLAPPATNSDPAIPIRDER